MPKTESLSPDIAKLRQVVRDFYSAQRWRMEMCSRALKLKTANNGVYAARVAAVKELEDTLYKNIRTAVRTIDIWPKFLKQVPGVGPAMGGVLINEYADPALYDSVGAVWAYAGLHVIHTCPKCKQSTNIAPTDSEGTRFCPKCLLPNGDRVAMIGHAPRFQRGKSANWNAFLRAKCVGVLGPSLLKAVRKDSSGTLRMSKYAHRYYEHRAVLIDRPCNQPPERHMRKDHPGGEAALQPNGCTNSHMHNRAIRVAVKDLLRDFYITWRTIRGLSVPEPHPEAHGEA